MNDILEDIKDRLHLFYVDMRILGCHLRLSFIKYRLNRLDSAKIMEDHKLTTLYLQGLNHK